MRHKGFTLIELLVTFAIVGVIIAAAIASIRYALSYSSDENKKTILTQLNNVISDYYAVNNFYPPQICNNTGADGMSSLPPVSILTQSGSSLAGSYPADPGNYTALLSKINSAGITSSFGYCTFSATAPTAYILVVKTQTGQACIDSANQSFYGFGSGSYINGSTNSEFYKIAVDKSLSLAGSGYSDSCFSQ